jgi:peptidoglycan/LPS O-acetylase OafA/YrhL
VDQPYPADRIWFLHLLRAFAVLGVLYSHVVSGPWAQSEVHARYANVSPPDLTGLTSPWDNPLLVPFIHGPLAWPYHHGVDTGAAGVGLFFLISGVLIPMALDRHRPTDFLITRIFRIYPVWVASLAIAAAWFVGHAAFTNFPPVTYGLTDWAANAGLITDWVPLKAGINPVAWTLLIEWKFYLLCAGLAAAGLLHRPAAILGSGVVVVTLGVAGHRYLVARPYSGEVLQTLASIARDSAPFLCVTLIGACIYHRFVGRWTSRTCVLLISALSLLMVSSFRYGTSDWGAGSVRIRSFAAAGVFFLIAYAFRSRIPYSRTLNWIADISYPMYAVHYLLGVGVMFTVYALLPIPLAAQIASVAVTLVASTALHRWVELPANEFGKRLASADWRRSPAPEEPEPEPDTVG